MRSALLLTLYLVSHNLLSQCVSFNPYFMGLPAFQVDLVDEEEKTLPIVFHVMHLGEPVGQGSNITAERIQETLAEVNAQFRKEPGGSGDGEGVDTKIEFCLAQRGPDGSPSNGITRHDLSGIPEFVADGIAISSTSAGAPDLEIKNIACWDVAKYVNVYVVGEIAGNNGGGGIQGYAYTGPTGNCLDGVVILANRVQVTPFTQGKVLTHELGHYLSLQHTFFNTFSCSQETNCETQGDMVCDTPPTTTNNFCSFPDCPDAITENYMDYTGESCRNMFTQGQAERMHALLQGPRSSLLSSPGCLPAVDYDIALNGLEYEETFCQQTQNLTAYVDVLGNLPLATASVVLESDGTTYTEDVYDLEPGTSYTVTFENVPLDGAFLVSLVSPLDEYPTNDTLSGFVSYEPGALFEMNLTTDFFATETSWILEGAEGVVLAEDDYSAGVVEYQYGTCLLPGCYTLTLYDGGGDGMPYGGALSVTVDGIAVETDISGDWGSRVFEFCVNVSECPYDFDGNGLVGNGDLLLFLTEYSCTSFCEYDLDGDGAVDVNDLLVFLGVWGTECTPEPFNLPTRTLPAEIQIYDLSGRRVCRPLDDLPTGFYIVAGPDGVQKLYKI
tara:strand:+ start:1553 stop:3391 length:1839 start_codon:yes stop_codon:yes gene_type:complete